MAEPSSSSSSRRGSRPFEPALPPVNMAMLQASAKSQARPGLRPPQDVNVVAAEIPGDVDPPVHHAHDANAGGDSVICKFFDNGGRGCRKGSNCKYLHMVRDTGTIFASRFGEPRQIWSSVTSSVRAYLKSFDEVPFEVWMSSKRVPGPRFRFFQPNIVTRRQNVDTGAITVVTEPVILPPDSTELILAFVENHLYKVGSECRVLSSTFINESFLGVDTMMVELQVESTYNVVATEAIHYEVGTRPVPYLMDRNEVPEHVHAIPDEIVERCLGGGIFLYHGTKLRRALNILRTGGIRAVTRYTAEGTSPVGIHTYPEKNKTQPYRGGAVFKLQAHGIVLSRRHSHWLRHNQHGVPIGCIAHFGNSTRDNHECVIHPQSFRIVSVIVNYSGLRSIILNRAPLQNMAAGLPNIDGPRPEPVD